MLKPCACPAIILSTFLAIVAFPGLSAAPVCSPPQAGPTLITFDFRVLSGSGQPVLDLKTDEVAVKLDGQPRDIMALELMRASVPGKPAAKPAPVMPSPFATNVAPSGGREVLVVLDDEAIAPSSEQLVKDAVAALLGGLGPADRVGLLTVPHGGPSLNPTTDHAAMRSLMADFRGRASGAESVADAACRSRLNLDALRGIFDNVVAGVPTTVVFITNGFTPPSAEVSVKVGVEPATGACEIRSRDLSDLSEAAVASHAQLYAVQVLDNTSGGAPLASDLTAGLEHVAGMTGNALVRLTNDNAAVMKRVADETSAYYLAAFEVSAAERNGASHRVEVSVTRPDVKVRARPTVTIARANAKPPRVKVPKARDMMAVPTVFRDLPLRAAGYSSRNASAQKVTLVAVFEPFDQSAGITEAMAGLFDSQGKMQAQWTAQSADLRRLPVVAALAAPPGTYRLRVAAVDKSGRGGTVDDEVKLELIDGGAVRLSALAFGAPSPQGLVPRLQFTDERAAVAYVEVYGVTKTMTVTASFELAASPDGPALLTMPGEIRAGTNDMRMAMVGIAVEQFPPGDVVVRAVITVDGQPVAAKPFRTLRKAQ